MLLCCVWKFIKDWGKKIETILFFRSDWLPSQTGILLSTQGVLELYKMTAANEDCPLQYITTSKVTSEGSENQFSSVRRKSGEGNPGPLKTKQSLRVDAMTQSVTPPRGANYRSTCDETALTLSDLVPDETIEIEDIHFEANAEAECVIEEERLLESEKETEVEMIFENHSNITRKGMFLRLQQNRVNF